MQASHAHSGRTDSTGCHNDKKYGERHCHSGNKRKKASNASDNRVTKSNNSASITPAYNRSQWRFRSYASNVNIGFYTKSTCDSIDIDHIVSLQDAYISGGYAWSEARKQQFANDKTNHQPACSRVNRSKGNSTPKDFFRKASDGKGVDYVIINKCDYLAIYKSIKQTYNLSFANNHPAILAQCD
ncbi:MAG: YHYH domain-containing protein [Alphaproteobacteria bacterium]|nr:YHYH domain-containing protein [Alphaproteobacteria bacterium]